MIISASLLRLALANVTFKPEFGPGPGGGPRAPHGLQALPLRLAVVGTFTVTGAGPARGGPGFNERPQ